MTKILVIAERPQAASELCAAGRSIASTVELISLNKAFPDLADINYNIIIPDGVAYECAYETVLELVKEANPDIIFVESSRRCRTISGRLAAKLDTSVITDITALDDKTASSRYFAGVANKKSLPVGLPIYTVVPGTFGDLLASGSSDVKEVELKEPAYQIKKLGSKPIEGSGVNLNDAKIIVGVGRGFTAKDDLSMAQDLAAKVGGEIGCTRPLAEGEDWLPRETYIGVTGLMLKPDTYFALGISGQMQHMIGVDQAQTIIAINKDKNAPIFKQCDIGLVGDIYKVLPAVVAAL